MEETEDEIDSNINLLQSKISKIKSNQSNLILKHYKKVQREKSTIENIQKIFDKGISSNNPVKMVFSSDKSVKSLPLLLNNSNSVIPHNNFNRSNIKDEYLVINEEIKINKNIIEENLFKLLKKNKSKSSKNINDNLLQNTEEQEKKDEKDVESIITEGQKSTESFSLKHKGATTPSFFVPDNKQKFINKKKKYKIKSSIKQGKKNVPIMKILNKPFFFVSSRNTFNSSSKIDVNSIQREDNIILSNMKFFKNNKNSQEKLNLTNIKSQYSSNNIKNVNLTKNKSDNNIVKYTSGLDPQNALFQFKLNLIRSKNTKQITQFSIYHFTKSNNIFIFIKNSKYKNFIKKRNLTFGSSPLLNNNKISHKIYEIEEDFYLPAAYRPRMNKWTSIPLCIQNTCQRGGIELIKNLENCNIIWKLMSHTKMRELARLINKYQKYNHFPCTFQLGRKDNLYKHIKHYKRFFPDLYNFVPATYLLLLDGKNFELDFKKYRKAIWIVKPVNLSRGRGVHILKGEQEFKAMYKKCENLGISPYLISRYIDKPHLINKKKYDLRIYVLIASFSPLRIYLYNNGLVRFATENYKKGDFDNVFIHLTNYSINKNNLKYKPNQDIEFKKGEIEEETENENFDEIENEKEIYDDSSKWSLIEYRQYFHKMGKDDIMEKIWKQIESIVVKTVITVSDDNYKEIAINKMNSLFELYGFDIMIDENFKAWLIEVNVNPSLHCTSPLDENIKTDLITDIFNVVGIVPYNHNNNGENVFDYLMKKTKIDFDINNYLFPKLRFTYNNFFSAHNEQQNHLNKGKDFLNNSNGFPFINNNNLIMVKSKVLKNCDPENLRQKLPEYNNDFYKKMIEVFEEETARSELTDFNLIFPLKNNIEFYSQIFTKTHIINDLNIVLWEHILNKK